MSFLKKAIFSFLIFFNAIINAESILIQNATIYDGKNNDGFIGNVLIEDNKISRVSTANLRGDLVIDATGKILTPGIIPTDSNIGIVEIGALSVTLSLIHI